MVKTLHKYSFLESSKIFITTLITLLALFAIVDFISHIDIFLKTSLKNGFLYVLARTPTYMVRIFPISMLLCAMFTASRFSSTHELIAVKSLGISGMRFLSPVIFLSGIVCFASLLLQEFVVPKTTKIAMELKSKTKSVRKNVFSVPPSVWFKSENQTFVYFGSFGKTVSKNISIFKLGKDFKPVERIDSKEAVETGNGTWILKEGYLRDLKELKSKKFKKLKVQLGITKKEILVSLPDPTSIKLSSLFHLAKNLEKLGCDAREMWLEFFFRISLSLLPLATALAGLPVGVFNPRAKKGIGILIAGGIIITMWILTSFSLSLGKAGILPPLYSALLPLLTMISISMILIERIEV